MTTHFNRRSFVRSIGMGAVSMTCWDALPSGEEPPERPNVLLIHVDQHRFDCLGACGNRDVLTPNIDSLATLGIRYENSFCSFPVCTPSRYSLICGQYVHEHRGFDNRSTLSPDIETFPRIMRSAGYKTKAVGKMHFTPTYLDVGFDEMELAEQDGPGRWDDDYHRYLMQLGLVDRNDLEDQRSEYREHASSEYWRTFGALVSNLPEKHCSTTWIGDRAVETLENWGVSSPHLLMVGFIKPHHPFDPPAPWHEMYNPDRLTLLPGWTPKCLDRDYLYSRGYFDNNTLTEQALRRVMAYYYATISQIDHHVGRMIRVLKRKTLFDKTMIIFTSDHGEYLGFHHLLLKGNYLYDPLARVPLIIKYPGNKEAGRVSDALVNNVDIAPTILNTAELKPGKSMKGLDLRTDRSGHDIVFSGRTESMARSKTKKLIVSKRKQGQDLFFDLERDPHEMRNLIEDPEYSKDIQRLREAIDIWQPERYRNREVYKDEDAPQIDQPNVPSRDRRHRESIIHYYQEKMSTRGA